MCADWSDSGAVGRHRRFIPFRLSSDFKYELPGWLRLAFSKRIQISQKGHGTSWLSWNFKKEGEILPVYDVSKPNWMEVNTEQSRPVQSGRPIKPLVTSMGKCCRQCQCRTTTGIPPPSSSKTLRQFYSSLLEPII